MDFLLQPETYISMLSLTLLEIVLGIDNVIFISILAGKLPEEQRNRARVSGLFIALFGRLVLLMGISWVVKLTSPLLSIMGWVLTGKGLILLCGGLFLLWKSAQEIYNKMEGLEHEIGNVEAKAVSFASIIMQIILIDMVFSLDSIITAVGLVSNIGIMVGAILVSMVVMMLCANNIGNFIDRHPSVKILALSFLLMIGTMLVAEAFHVEIPKGYIYFSLAFALLVEAINIRFRSKLNKRH